MINRGMSGLIKLRNYLWTILILTHHSLVQTQVQIGQSHADNLFTIPNKSSNFSIEIKHYFIYSVRHERWVNIGGGIAE